MLAKPSLCSILFHALLVLAIYGIRDEAAPVKQNPVEIKLVSIARSPVRGAQRKKGRSSKEITSMLFPSYRSTLLAQVVANSDPQQKSENDVPEFARTYQGMDMTKIIFIKSLWHEIDRSIVESKYLSEYGHVGKVSLSFEITPEGHIVESHFRAQAFDSILKVVATRAVRKALKNESENLILPKETTKVQADFNWADYSTCARLRGTQKNFLSFCKYGENKRKSFTASERSMTYLEAIYKHGPWAIEEIQNYKREEDHRKTQFDPFEEMRRDPDYNLGS